MASVNSVVVYLGAKRSGVKRCKLKCWEGFVGMEQEVFSHCPCLINCISY